MEAIGENLTIGGEGSSTSSVLQGLYGFYIQSSLGLRFIYQKLKEITKLDKTKLTSHISKGLRPVPS